MDYSEFQMFLLVWYKSGYGQRARFTSQDLTVTFGAKPHARLFIRNLLFHIKIYSTTIWTYNSLTITFCLWTFSRLKLCNLCSNLFDIHCQNYIWVSEKLASFSAQIIIAKFQNVFDWARRGRSPMYDSLEVHFSIAKLAKRRIRLFIWTYYFSYKDLFNHNVNLIFTVFTPFRIRARSWRILSLCLDAVILALA